MIAFTLVCSLALFSHRSLEASERREILPNGCLLIAFSDKSSTVCEIDCGLSAQGMQDETRSGARHLVEHLMMGGSDGRLDWTLESDGGFSLAETQRDATIIQILVKPNNIEAGFDALTQIQKSGPWKESQVQEEAKTIHQELLLRTALSRTSESLWSVALGQKNDDPMGNMESLDKLAPAELGSVKDKLFTAPFVSLVVRGPEDVDDLLAYGEKWLSALKKSNREPWAPRETEKGAVSDWNTSANLRAAWVPAFDTLRCAADLAVAYGIASQNEGGFVTYTPSARPGLVIVGKGDDKSQQSLADLIDLSSQENRAAFYDVGKSLALTYIDDLLNNPRKGDKVRAAIASEVPTARLETMRQRIESLSQTDFLSAFSDFQKAGQ